MINPQGTTQNTEKQSNRNCRVAILCRKSCKSAVEISRYFHQKGVPILFIIENGIRRKYPEARLQCFRAWRNFYIYLFRKYGFKVKQELLLPAIWAILPAACRPLIESCRVINEAKINRIPYFIVKNHSSADTKYILEKERIYYVLFTSSNYLIKEPLLSLENIKIINAHCAKLPEHRSTDSLAWSIMQNDKIGLSAHFIDSGVDTGPILSFWEVKPQKGDNLIRLRQRIDSHKPRMFFDVIQGLITGAIKPAPQNLNEGVHHRPMTFHELIRTEQILQEKLGSEQKRI